MHVKGTAYLARQSHVSRERGAVAFAAVVADIAKVHPVFGEPIIATSLLPVREFLALNDAIVARLYGGDELSYLRFGEASATWGLTIGPYKKFVTTRNVTEFIASVPTIYRSYFNFGAATSKLLSPELAELRLSGIEPRHLYFEYAISGYFARGLELVTGSAVKLERKRGFSRGDADVHYVAQLAK